MELHSIKRVSDCFQSLYLKQPLMLIPSLPPNSLKSCSLVHQSNSTNSGREIELVSKLGSFNGEVVLSGIDKERDGRGREKWVLGEEALRQEQYGGSGGDQGKRREVGWGIEEYGEERENVEILEKCKYQCPHFIYGVQICGHCQM